MIPIYTTDCEVIQMKDLLHQAKQKLKLALVQNELEINGINSSITASQTGGGGFRYWFTCPQCQKRCGVLFRSPLNSEIVACQKCLAVKYKKILSTI